MDELKQQHKIESEKKDLADAQKKEWKFLDRREKIKYETEFKKTLDNTMTEEGVLARGKKEKIGDTMDEILATLKKEYPTFAGYIEEEILTKKDPLSNAA